MDYTKIAQHLAAAEADARAARDLATAIEITTPLTDALGLLVKARQVTEARAAAPLNRFERALLDIGKTQSIDDAKRIATDALGG